MSITNFGYVSATTVTSSGIGIQYPGATIGGGSANTVGFRWSSPNLSGTVDNVTSMVVGNNSDRRLKKIKGNVSHSTQTIYEFKPIVYEPLDFQGNSATPPIEDNTGFIADEVELIAPWLVTGEATANTFQSIHYGGFTPLLVASIKETCSKAFGYVRLRDTDGGAVITNVDTTGSFNLGNITQISTGLWSVNFINQMKTPSYAISVSFQGYNLDSNIIAEPGHPDAGIKTTAGFGIRFSANNTNINPNDLSVTVHEKQ